MCPITLRQLNDTSANSLYTLQDVLMNGTDIRIDTSVNMHKEFNLWTKTDSGIEANKTFKINVCGAGDLQVKDASPAEFNLNLTSQTVSLSTLAGFVNLTDWFDKSDVNCPFIGFKLMKLNPISGLLEDYNSTKITLVGADITVNADSSTRETVYL